MIQNRKDKVPSAISDGEITIPFSVGRVLALAPLAVLFLIALGIYFSGAVQMLLAERELSEYSEEHDANALKFLNWALAANPNHARAHQKRAELLCRLEQKKGMQGNFAAAHDDIEKAVKLQPQDFSILSTRLDIDHAARNYELEIAECTDAIKVAPWLTAFRENRADTYYITGDRVKERADRETIIEEAGHDPIAYDRRADQYAYLGQLDKAAHDYETAVNEEEKPGLLLSKLATLYENMKQPKQAIGVYSKILELNKKNPDEVFIDEDKALYRRANLYLKTGQYKLALADADELVASDNECPHRRSFRAKILDAISRHDAATADRKAALSQVNGEINKLSVASDAESKASAYEFRGGYYSAEEQWKNALSDYLISVSVKPNAQRYNLCAQMYTKLGDYDHAIEYFSKAIAAQPDGSDLETAYNGTATAHLAQHRPDLAVKDSTNCIMLGTKSAEASHLRAEAYRQLGKKDLAELDENEAIGLEFSPLPDIS